MSAGKQAAFSLVEVLVAMAVVMVGLVGIAGLQAVSLQQNRNALFRVQALQLGEDMLERIRANPTGDYGEVSFTVPPAPAPKDCARHRCNPADMASYDITEWKCSINPAAPDNRTWPSCETGRQGHGMSLPGGAGAISLAGEVYTVEVQWQAGGGRNPVSVTLSTRVD